MSFNTPRAPALNSDEGSKDAAPAAPRIATADSTIASNTLKLERRIHYLERRLSLTPSAAPHAELDEAFRMATRNFAANEITAMDDEMEGGDVPAAAAPPTSGFGPGPHYAGW